MERTFVIVVVAALGLACSSVDERDGCSASADCPAGQYCARTGDGNVCWADAVAPVVTGVSASCAEAGGCRRDSVLHVTATVTEATSDVLDATVALDLPGGPAVAMTRDGSQWKADVDLRRFPFDHFERSVVATVTARDGARNVSEAAPAAGVSVTRLRWTYDAGVPMTSPAVMDDGTVVVGLSATSGQLLAITPGGTQRWSLSVGGTAFVTAAPAIGEHAIWVGSEDFNLHAVTLDGSAVIVGVGVQTGGAIGGSIAVLPAAGKEWAFATSSAGFIGAASNVPTEYAAEGPNSAFSVGPVIGLDGNAYAATSAGSATLRSFRLTTSPVNTLSEAWTAPAPVGANVSAPLAVDAGGNIWTGTLDRKLSRTAPTETTGQVTTIATLPGSVVGSPTVLANGDLIVGDDTGLLHRFSSEGVQIWTAEPNLGAPVNSPVLLSDAEMPIVVSAMNGRMFALRSNGMVAWSATLDAGKALRSPNLHTPPDQSIAVLSTAYVASASGKLFAVVVDGQLDASAPWPKAFHDRKNTNRAGPQP